MDSIKVYDNDDYGKCDDIVVNSISLVYCCRLIPVVERGKVGKAGLDGKSFQFWVLGLRGLEKTCGPGFLGILETSLRMAQISTIMTPYLSWVGVLGGGSGQ